MVFENDFKFRMYWKYFVEGFTAVTTSSGLLPQNILLFF